MVRLSRKQRIQWGRVATIVVIWLLIGILIGVYDYLTLQSSLIGTAERPAPVDLGGNDFLANLGFNIFAALMGGLMGGSFLVFYANERLRERSYGYTLLSVGLTFVFIVVTITIILGIFSIKVRTGEWPFGNREAWREYTTYMRDPLHAKNIIVWASVTLLTQIALQVNDKFGPGLLWDFIRGKYNTPQNEERIFMFLDLTSSTTIAEKLGNKRYYSLLRDFYADITNAIVYNGGEIYQYVGDEVVVSWKQEIGLEDGHCIKCYFDIREAIGEQNQKYMDRYGLVPDFKAAIHKGAVTAGEIGVIKKDITYSGDVLNTTARILSRCNSYKERLLISGTLQREVNALKELFSFDKVGDEQLRGKTELIDMYAVNLK